MKIKRLHKSWLVQGKRIILNLQNIIHHVCVNTTCIVQKVVLGPITILSINLSEFTQPHATPHTFIVVYFSQSVGFDISVLYVICARS